MVEPKINRIKYDILILYWIGTLKQNTAPIIVTVF